MLAAFPNMIILIMHHQACLLLACSLLRPDKSSASFNPLTGTHAHTCEPKPRGVILYERCHIYSFSK